MTVLYKETTTRPSLEHQFWFDSNLYRTALFEDDGKKLISKFFVAENIQDSTSIILNSYYTEMISWQEVFLKKDLLRPDFKYLIDLHNLTYDKMDGVGPPYNPFSLTHTNFVIYNNWEDFLYDEKIFFRQYDNFENLVIANENLVLGEYFIDGDLIKTATYNYQII